MHDMHQVDLNNKDPDRKLEESGTGSEFKRKQTNK